MLACSAQDGRAAGSAQVGRMAGAAGSGGMVDWTVWVCGCRGGQTAVDVDVCGR